MASDPFKIEGPAVVSFSGGRTSGYMLWRILQSHGGTLPPDVKVVFCNTGKERPETLDFVERCACEWGVSVVWVEYRRSDEGAHGFAVVDYATASRHGEPIEALVRARSQLPNPVISFCIQEVKQRPLKKWCVSSLGWGRWTNLVGIRADEPHRLSKGKGNARRERYEVEHPLAAAGVSLGDVSGFWASHPFDLQLRSDEGNCDLCFLKGAGKTERLMRDRPDLAQWWIDMERGISGNDGRPKLFRRDRPSYAALLERSKRASLPMMDDGPDELSIACHCTD